MVLCGNGVEIRFHHIVFHEIDDVLFRQIKAHMDIIFCRAGHAKGSYDFNDILFIGNMVLVQYAKHGRNIGGHGINQRPVKVKKVCFHLQHLLVQYSMPTDSSQYNLVKRHLNKDGHHKDLDKILVPMIF